MARFTTSDGLSLYYEDRGQGHPILCLAGLTRNSRDFDFVAPHLAGHRMITMDYRGRGLSDDAPDPLTYTIPQEAADALALLDHLGLEKAAILGTSRGGLIAMVIAATAKDRLIGVALNDIGPEILPEGLAGIEAYIGRQPAAPTMAALTAGTAAFFAADFPDVPMTRWADHVANTHWDTAHGPRIAYDPALRTAYLAAAGLPAPDLWPLFDAIAPLPCAVLHGVNSNILSAQTVAAMKTKAPNLLVASVPNRGHVPFLDEPSALEALSQWIGQMQ